MAFVPGLGEIAKALQAAYQLYTLLKAAPEEFTETAREIKDLKSVLKQIEKQAQDPWSPLRKNKEAAIMIERAVAACQTQLEELDSKLRKYNSLSEKPKATERVRYITHNFTPNRDAIRQRRVEIYTQLNLCQTGQLGQILKILSQIAADENAGRRPELLTDEDATDDDIMSVLSTDGSVPPAQIQANWDDIRAYIRDARAEAIAASDRSELTPGDSASVITESTLLGNTHGREDLYPQGLNLSISEYQGIAIQSISCGTILDPHRTSNGIIRTGTFDVWRLASLSINLQTRISKGIKVAHEASVVLTKFLNSVLAELSRLQPILLLLVADSSTDKDFWARLERERRFRSQLAEHCSQQDFKSQHISEAGDGLIDVLDAIGALLDGFEQQAHERKASTGQTQRHSMLVLPRSQDTPHPIGKATPAESLTQLEGFCETIIEWTAASSFVIRSDFVEHLEVIDRSWQSAYAQSSQDSVKSSASQNGSGHSSMFVEWLHGVQNLECLGRSTITNLAVELYFASASGYAHEFRNTRVKYYQDYYWKKYGRESYKSGLGLSTGEHEALKEPLRAVWPHDPAKSDDQKIVAMDQQLCPEYPYALPRKWEARMTLQRRRCFVEPNLGLISARPPPKDMSERQIYIYVVKKHPDDENDPTRWSISEKSRFY